MGNWKLIFAKAIGDGGLAAGIACLEEMKDSCPDEERSQILSTLVDLKSAHIIMAPPSQDQEAMLENLKDDVDELVGIVASDEADISWSAYGSLLHCALYLGQKSLLEIVAKPALNLARTSALREVPTDPESSEIRDCFLHHVALTACVLGEAQLLEDAYCAIQEEHWIRDKYKLALLDRFGVTISAKFVP